MFVGFSASAPEIPPQSKRRIRAVVRATSAGQADRFVRWPVAGVADTGSAPAGVQAGSPTRRRAARPAGHCGQTAAGQVFSEKDLPDNGSDVSAWCFSFTLLSRALLLRSVSSEMAHHALATYSLLLYQ